MRFMAQSMPRVSAKPVSFVSTLYSAVNTGTSEYFSRSCLVSPASAATSRFSARKEIGAYPAFNARSITLGLSAINTPGAVQNSGEAGLRCSGRRCQARGVKVCYFNFI